MTRAAHPSMCRPFVIRRQDAKNAKLSSVFLGVLGALAVISTLCRNLFVPQLFI